MFQIKEILLMLFISIILMSALTPFVDRLEKFKFPRVLAITVVYIVLSLLIGAIIATIVPGLVDQTGKLVRLLPSALEKVRLIGINQQDISREIITQVGALPSNFVKITVSLFSNIIGVISTLVITFYLLFERRNLHKHLTQLLGNNHPDKIIRAVNLIEVRLGSWVRGELFLMFIIGILTYIGLLILGIDIALPLAVLAGLLEIIPNIGSIVSAVPAVLIALTIHPLVAVAVVALYFLVQLLENNLIIPHVMRQATGINPLVSIVALLIGFKLAGPAGAVLSLPSVIIIETILTEVFSSSRFSSLAK